MEPFPCDVIKNGHHIGFNPKLDIIRKRRQVKISDARHVKYDTSKQLLQTVSKCVQLRKTAGTDEESPWINSRKNLMGGGGSDD